jgi:hypothetical protein
VKLSSGSFLFIYHSTDPGHRRRDERVLQGNKKVLGTNKKVLQRYRNGTEAALHALPHHPRYTALNEDEPETGTAILFFIVAYLEHNILSMSKAKFGKAPAGTRLERIIQSPNYRNGQFQNLSPTPQLAEGV